MRLRNGRGRVNVRWQSISREYVCVYNCSGWLIEGGEDRVKIQYTSLGMVSIEIHE